MTTRTLCHPLWTALLLSQNMTLLAQWAYNRLHQRGKFDQFICNDQPIFLPIYFTYADYIFEVMGQGINNFNEQKRYVKMVIMYDCKGLIPAAEYLTEDFNVCKKDSYSESELTLYMAYETT